MAAASLLQSQFKVSFLERWTPRLFHSSVQASAKNSLPQLRVTSIFSLKCHLLRKVLLMMLSKIPPENLYHSPFFTSWHLYHSRYSDYLLVSSTWLEVPGRQGLCLVSSYENPVLGLMPQWTAAEQTKESKTWFAHAPMLMQMSSLCPDFHYVEVRDYAFLKGTRYCTLFLVFSALNIVTVIVRKTAVCACGIWRCM